MVTFRLIEEDEQRIVYWYFPEGKEDKGHGVIIMIYGFLFICLSQVLIGWMIMSSYSLAADDRSLV